MRVSKTVSANNRPSALSLVFVFMSLMFAGATSASGQEVSYSSMTRARTTTAPVTQRKVFVRSTALLVKASVVEDKLMKRAEFAQMGLVLTRAKADADIILELRHDILTKYVYSAVDAHTQVVLAGGKVSSLGGTVAGKVAKRFLKQLAQGHP
jgi:hypothetical protein